MKIDGINENFVSNTIESAKMKSTEVDFEQRLQAAMDNEDDKEIRQVCRDFEKIFLSMMYKQMKATVPKAELFPEDASRDIFESMMDDSLMEEVSKGNGLGLGDVLYKQLKKQLNNKYTSINGSEGETDGDKGK